MCWVTLGVLLAAFHEDVDVVACLWTVNELDNVGVLNLLSNDDFCLDTSHYVDSQFRLGGLVTLLGCDLHHFLYTCLRTELPVCLALLSRSLCRPGAHWVSLWARLHILDCRILLPCADWGPPQIFHQLLYSSLFLFQCSKTPSSRWLRYIIPPMIITTKDDSPDLQESFSVRKPQEVQISFLVLSGRWWDFWSYMKKGEGGRKGGVEVKKVLKGWMWGWSEAVSADTLGQLKILGHNGDPLGMNCTEVSVFKERHQVGFGSFLEGKHSLTLESDFLLELGGDLTHQSLEGQLPNQQVGLG